MDNDEDIYYPTVDHVTTERNLAYNPSDNPSVTRVECVKSPHFYGYYNHSPCKIIIDTGAESNIIPLSLVRSANIQMNRSMQSARQLDGSVLSTCGEVNISLRYGKVVFKLNALVVESMGNHILAGMPFCRQNGLEMSI